MATVLYFFTEKRGICFLYPSEKRQKYFVNNKMSNMIAHFAINEIIIRVFSKNGIINKTIFGVYR